MLYDRVLRAELFESNRYLDLHSDTSRLAWVSLLPLADDYGNLDGNTRRLWRWLAPRTVLKTEADVTKTIGELADADLVRAYQVGEAWYLHIPRFRSDRSYRRRLSPASPWCDPNEGTGPGRRDYGRQAFAAVKRSPDQVIANLATERQREQTLTPKADAGLTQVSVRPDADLTPGVERKGYKVKGEADTTAVQQGSDADSPTSAQKGRRLPPDWSLPADWQAWATQFAKDQGRAIAPDQVRLVGDQFRDYWLGKVGRDAAKADWLATWRKWFRTEYTEGRLSRLPPDQGPGSSADVLKRAT